MVIIDKDRLQTAYRILGYHTLWRKGYINGDNPFSPQEVSDAMMVAAGAIQDLFGAVAERNVTEKNMDTYMNMCEKFQKENKRLRAILSRHGIKHAKVKSEK